MELRALPLASLPLALALALAGCTGDGDTTDAAAPQADESELPPGMEEMQEYEENPDGVAEPATVALDETHDFGDGFTIRIVDVERRIAEDGWNSTTGEEGDLPYIAWTVEITNGTDAPIHTGSITSSCSVGDPLMESEAPVLGESINPPDQLAAGQSGAWEEDCWASEEDTQLQWTIEFYDENSAPLYPPVTFAGEIE
ncbi:hypothetical protein [Nocardiopsis synnemataformans]|uniref:hypothetical protein n=1 Tax=Nocardiopsis synnemataformans TaxID=61305 RepID=UPI003EBD8D66